MPIGQSKQRLIFWFARTLTRTCGGPILLSELTRRRLGLPVALSCLGAQEIEGYQRKLFVYQVEDRCEEPMLTKTFTS